MSRIALMGMAVVVVLGACGSDDPSASNAAPSDEDPAVAAAFGEVEDAVVATDAPLCPGAGEYQPAPATDAATSAPHFRYTNGRIYELGPCELPQADRGELRVYHYADTAQRDDAAASSVDRNPRPMFLWASGDELLIEQWVFTPTEIDPAFDEVVTTVHDAISDLPDTEGVTN